VLRMRNSAVPILGSVSPSSLKSLRIQTFSELFSLNLSPAPQSSSTMAELNKATVSALDSPSSIDESKSPSLLEASLSDGDSSDRFASIDTKKLMRRVDWRVLPYIIVS